MIAPHLDSSLVNLYKPENKSQLKLLIDPNSIRMNSFLINTIKPVSFYSNMLSFGASNKINFSLLKLLFELDGDLLKTMTICDFNVSHYNPQDQEIKL